MILSIDFGSTSFKAVVCDETLNQQGSGSCRLQYRYGSDGEVDLEPDEVTRALRVAIEGAVTASGVDVSAIRTVAITSQAQTFTVLNKNGHPKIPFISWQDMRAGDACQELRSLDSLTDFAYHTSFGECSPLLQICQIKHLQKTRPGFISQDDLVVPLPAYFVYQCCGKSTVDTNLAAMSGLYSLREGDWWPAALQACELEKSQLPGLVPIGTMAGATKRGGNLFGLPEMIPIVLAGNDQTAGAYGARLHENRSLLITLGTAHVAYVCRKTPSVPDAAVICGPYPDGLHYQMVADECGGNIVNWAREVLAGCGTEDAFFNLAAKAAPGCGGLVFQADLPSGQGTWKNIGLQHSTADFARSILENLAQRMTKIIKRLGVNMEKKNILVAGGGSLQPLWIRILSDALGVEVSVTEASPLTGAALMASQSLLTPVH